MRRCRHYCLREALKNEMGKTSDLSGGRAQGGGKGRFSAAGGGCRVNETPLGAHLPSPRPPRTWAAARPGKVTCGGLGVAGARLVFCCSDAGLGFHGRAGRGADGGRDPRRQKLQQAPPSLCLCSLPLCWAPLATGSLQWPGEPAALDR